MVSQNTSIFFKFFATLGVSSRKRKRVALRYTEASREKKIEEKRGVESEVCIREYK